MMAAVPGESRSRRAEAQRNRILNAAQRCFAERGFHGASMAAIADTAQMSAGLIYRYFDNKSALIHGIVSRQMELLERDVHRRDSSDSGDIVARIVEGFRKDAPTTAGRDVEAAGRLLEPALVLEITAESSRDPLIGDALSSFSQRIDDALAGWLAASPESGGCDVEPDKLEARTLVLRALLDGLKMRQAREPGLDLELLREALQEALPKLIGD